MWSIMWKRLRTQSKSEVLQSSSSGSRSRALPDPEACPLCCGEPCHICAGSTGVSLAMVAAAHGCRCAVALPDDAASEKGALLEALGARVLRQRPVSIAHPQHFVNVARRAGGGGGRGQPCGPWAQQPWGLQRAPAAPCRRRAAADSRGGRAQPCERWTQQP